MAKATLLARRGFEETMNGRFFLGIDGGQSHTEAVVADARGHIRGRGRSGPSNHAEQPGGRQRLARAVGESVRAALGEAKIAADPAEVEFEAAHCAMTGGADFKEEVIRSIVRARRLVVGHDAPAALAGATGAEPGIVVIAGTGSVVYGEDGRGRAVRSGGWGYLLGDEGSGYWIALEGLRRALHAEDGLDELTSLGGRALCHFNAGDFRELAAAIYAGRIDRDRLASFAVEVETAARQGDSVAQRIMSDAVSWLVRLVVACSRRLQCETCKVACVGGVFRGEMVRDLFAHELRAQLPAAHLIAPRFDPAVGALLLAYRAAGCGPTAEILSNLERTGRR